MSQENEVQDQVAEDATTAAVEEPAAAEEPAAETATVVEETASETAGDKFEQGLKLLEQGIALFGEAAKDDLIALVKKVL